MHTSFGPDTQLAGAVQRKENRMDKNVHLEKGFVNVLSNLLIPVKITVLACFYY